MTVLAGVLALGAIISAAASEWGWTAAWPFLGDPAAIPFLDLRHVTDAVACVRRGIDVYRDASCDLQGRLFDLPPVWLDLSAFGITSGDATRLALGMDGAALIVLLRLIRGRSVRAGGFALLALVSPAIASGIERGNTDLLVFALVGGAALLLDRPRRILAASALVFAAVALKLYPVAACLSAARDRRWTAAMVAVGAASLAYLVAILDHLPLIFANMIQAGGVYGATAVLNGGDIDAARPAWPWLAAAETMALAVLAATGVAAAAAARRGAASCELSAESGSAAFQFGAAIYCLTFLLGANLACRLVFLLLLVPQLFDWAERGGRATRLVALALLALVQGVLWTPQGWTAAVLLGELLQWLLFAGLAFVLWQDLLFVVPRRPLPAADGPSPPPAALFGPGAPDGESI